SQVTSSRYGGGPSTQSLGLFEACTLYTTLVGAGGALTPVPPERHARSELPGSAHGAPTLSSYAAASDAMSRPVPSTPTYTPGHAARLANRRLARPLPSTKQPTDRLARLL